MFTWMLLGLEIVALENNPRLIILKNSFRPTNIEVKWTVLYPDANGLIIQSGYTSVAQRNCTARIWNLWILESRPSTAIAQYYILPRR